MSRRANGRPALNRHTLHRGGDGAVVLYELVETWRCSHCGKRFRRRIPLATLEPPRGYALHARACRRKAKAIDFDLEEAAP